MILQINGVEVNIENVTQKQYDEIVKLLNQQLALDSQKRNAIYQAFVHAIQLCPNANPSDLWHHVIYRQYFIAMQPTGVNPGQSWVRAGGDALEIFFCDYYTRLLSKHGIRLRWLKSKPEKKEALIAIQCEGSIGEAKLDTVLEGMIRDRYYIFGGAHIKASFGERISDDQPTSHAMQRKGLFSPLLTLDVKSFPPQRKGNEIVVTPRTYINIGEFNTIENPTVKRKYIETQGIFDNCYCYNLRTIPSNPVTHSRKRVIVTNLNGQPDSFVNDVVAFWTNFRKKIR